MLDLPGGRRWAVEVKRSSAPKVSKGLHLGAADIQASEVFVAYPGDGEFPVSTGITAVPLLALARRLASLG